MKLSPSFVLGLAVLVLADSWTPALPGQEFPGRFVWFAVALATPVVTAAATGARLRALARLGEPPSAAMATLCRLQGLTVPLSMFLLVAQAGLVPLAEDVGGGSHVVWFAVLLTPLLLLELGLRLTELRTARALDALRAEIPPGMLAGWWRLTGFVVAPILAFAAVLDLVGTRRELDVFFRGTTLGTTLGLLLAIALLGFVLPILFRVLLPTRRSLPFRVAEHVNGAAARLGFPRTSILALDTRHRMVNAALVGPFRWPRYLVLTDGILACLDAPALEGVVAHEVGHARAGHPALLMLVFGAVPVLLIQPVTSLDLASWAPGVLIGLGAVLALVAFFALRWLMHRFEFEADQLSAAALGGAMPCILALRRVGDLFPGHREHTSFRHPSEDRRVRSLLEWEADPAYRAAFARRGRAVRIGVAAITTLALSASVWSHARTWPVDAVVWRLYTGDFVGAERGLAALGPEVEGERAREIAAEVRAARSLMGDGGEWDQVARDLSDRAWERALQVATAEGARAARPYFALAVSSTASDAVRESAWLFSEALAGDDEERAREVAAHIARLPDVPPDLLAAVEAGVVSSG